MLGAEQLISEHVFHMNYLFSSISLVRKYLNSIHFILQRSVSVTIIESADLADPNHYIRIQQGGMADPKHYFHLVAKGIRIRNNT